MGTGTSLSLNFGLLGLTHDRITSLTSLISLTSLRPGAFIFLPGDGGAISKHPKPGVTQINYGLCRSTNHTDLELLRVLVEGGQVKPHVEKVFPLAQVVDAFKLSQVNLLKSKLPY